jgi:Leucine-rich repeat (LRR) protein
MSDCDILSNATQTMRNGPDLVAVWKNISISNPEGYCCINHKSLEVQCDENNRIILLRRGTKYHKPLGGLIPTALGLLTSLQLIDLGSQSFLGPLPTEIGYLKQLNFLSFAQNSLSGTLPTEIGQLSLLEKMYLSTNQFYGDLPQEIGNLHNLKLLHLHENEFSGLLIKNLSRIMSIETMYVHFFSLYNETNIKKNAEHYMTIP